MELTNALRKSVASLSSARERRLQGLFVVEGTKCVLDTLGHFTCRYLFATAQWLSVHGSSLEGIDPVVVKSRDIERMSSLSTPQQVLAVYDLPSAEFDPRRMYDSLVLALDRVQDPGNLGTIVRIADWFGIRDILCSPETADAFNPKAVQASMGAVSRVNLFYADLPELFSRNPGVEIYGTFLDGDDIYRQKLSAAGVILMGNEGQGISPEAARFVSRRLLVPSYPAGGSRSCESLNVAVAAALVVAEFRRR